MIVKQTEDPERAARIKRAVDNCTQDAVETAKRDMAKQEQALREKQAAKISDGKKSGHRHKERGKTIPRPMMVSDHRDPLGDVVFEMPMKDLVIVGHRKNFGDIDALAKSILTERLIFPIVLAPDYSVLSGERRVKALEALGEKAARVVVVQDYEDARKRLLAEAEEDTTKPMLPSEKMALTMQLRELEKTAAGNRDVWTAAGFPSSGGYSRIKRVYDATLSDQTRLAAFAQELLNKLDDDTVAPTTALAALEEFRQNGGGILHKGKSSARGQVTAIRNSLLGLEGITTGLETAFHGGFERSCTRTMAAETAAALAGYSARLNRVARRLRAYGTEET